MEKLLSFQTFDTPLLQGFDTVNNLLLINKEHLLARVYIGVSHRFQSLFGLLCALQCKLDYSPFGELGLILVLLCRMQFRFRHPFMKFFYSLFYMSCIGISSFLIQSMVTMQSHFLQ
jgi:hypothetical protein